MDIFQFIEGEAASSDVAALRLWTTFPLPDGGGTVPLFSPDPLTGYYCCRTPDHLPPALDEFSGVLDVFLVTGTVAGSLVGVPVPEPSATFVLAVGFAALCVLSVRRRTMNVRRGIATL